MCVCLLWLWNTNLICDWGFLYATVLQQQEMELSYVMVKRRNTLGLQRPTRLTIFTCAQGSIRGHLFRFRLLLEVLRVNHMFLLRLWILHESQKNTHLIARGSKFRWCLVWYFLVDFYMLFVDCKHTWGKSLEFWICMQAVSYQAFFKESMNTVQGFDISGLNLMMLDFHKCFFLFLVK